MSSETSESGGVYASERVRHFAFQCGEVFKRCMLGLLRNGLAMREIDPRLARVSQEAICRFSLESLREWPQSTRDEEAANALRSYPDMGDNYKFAFVLYARNFYGTDQYGNRNALDLRIPPFAYFLFELYSLGLDDPRIVFDGFYEGVDYWRFTKTLVRRCLCLVTKGRVALQANPDGGQGGVTRLGGSPATNYATPPASLVVAHDVSEPIEDDDPESEDEAERRRRRRHRRRHHRSSSRDDRHSRHRHHRERRRFSEGPPPPPLPPSVGPSTSSGSHWQAPPVIYRGGPSEGAAEPPGRIININGGSDQMPERNDVDGTYAGMGAAPAYSDVSSMSSDSSSRHSLD